MESSNFSFEEGFMEVEVRVFAGLERYLPENKGRNSCRIQMNPGENVKDILSKLNIPAPQHEEFMILANGIHANLNYTPGDGDIVSIFPIIAGG